MFQLVSTLNLLQCVYQIKNYELTWIIGSKFIIFFHKSIVYSHKKYSQIIEVIVISKKTV